MPEAGPEQIASRQAVAEGRSVEVSALTGETSRTLANSDGTFTLESSPVVERVRRAGGWVPVDPTLVKRADGRPVPKAAQDVVLSGGGSVDPLARISRDGKSYELGSPWPLPVPRLSGSMAVYEGVRPGVDLVVDVRPDGFTQNLVLHNRAAASDPALRSIRFPVRTQGLSVRSDANGNVSITDEANRSVFTTSAALMWDSTTPSGAPAARSAARVGAASVAPSPEGSVLPDPGSRTAVASVAVADQTLSVSPDQGFLAAPETTYPVVIDPPAVTGTLTGWTTLWSNMPSTSFWKTSHALGVGYDAWVDNKKSRSLFQFDTRKVAGKKILDATFTSYAIWSANCTPKDVGLYRTRSISSGTNWGSNGNLGWSFVSKVSAAKGFSANCPDGDIEFNATSAVAHTANAKSATTTLGLTADESDPYAWKQFMSPADPRAGADRKPRLSITYVSPVDTAPSYTKLANPNLACSSKTSPALIRTRTPRLTATPTSKDGSQASLRPKFDIYNTTTSSPKLHTLTPSTWTGSGTAGSVTTPQLDDGMVYSFWAATEYRYTHRGTTSTMTGPYTGCYFKIDITAPPQPTITSATYPPCAAEDCAGVSETGGVGAPSTFTIAAGAPDVRRYDISLNGVLVETKIFSSNTASYQATVVPDKKGTNRLRVETVDAAGYRSAHNDYLFNVAAGSTPVGQWPLDDNTGTTSADTSGSAHTMTLSQPSWTDKARLGGGLKGAGSTTYAATANKVVNTGQSFAVAAWVKLDSRSQTTVLQQRGTTTGAFQLYYSQGYDRWIFNRYAADATDAQTTITRAVSQRAPVVGAWTHLMGVYDDRAKKIRLYVNGVEEGTAEFTTPWAGNGPLEIGRWGTEPQLAGDVDHVQVWNRAVFPDELPAIVNLEDPATGHPRSAALAHWTMDGPAASTSAPDASGRGNHLAFHQNASLDTTDDHGRGSVLLLNNQSGSYATSNTAVDPNGSFTVAGWVDLAHYPLLDDTTIAHSPTIFSLPGTQRDALRMWYRQEAGQTMGTWRFALMADDILGGPAAEVVSEPSNTPTGWVHLTAVFNAPDQSLKIYLGGVRQGAEQGVLSKGAFQPGGPLTVGRGRRHDTGAIGNHFGGRLDDLRVYAGVLSEPQITALVNADAPVEIG
ncbi:LamG domain-containing protein [Streptomyces sp. NPDC006798]|uniref:LamG domain-containing protein n=1 Tax=Streptomyces sp. NPDC006798 TaxID=3155462 RepID=UPI0033D93782